MQVAGAVAGSAQSTQARPRAGQGGAVEDEDYYEEVEEGVHATCRYSSFSKKTQTKRWTTEETKLFYAVDMQSRILPSLPHRLLQLPPAAASNRR